MGYPSPHLFPIDYSRKIYTLQQFFEVERHDLGCGAVPYLTVMSRGKDIMQEKNKEDSELSKTGKKVDCISKINEHFIHHAGRLSLTRQQGKLL